MLLIEAIKEVNMKDKLFRTATNILAISFTLAIVASVAVIVVRGGPDAFAGLLFEGVIPVSSANK